MNKEEIIKELSKKKKEELKKLLGIKKNITKKEIVKELSKKKKKELEELLNNKPEKIIKEKNNKIWMIILSLFIGISIIIWIISSQNTITGKTTLVYLIDKNCNDCYNVSINGPILRQYGLNPTIKEYDINSNNGKQLINKYNIEKIPTFIVFGVNNSYEKLLAVWPSVGTIENDGALVFRMPEKISNNFEVINSSGSFNKYKAPQEILGGFIDTGEEICKENEKPIIYFFGSNSCPHCRWEHPIINNITSMFNNSIVYYDNMGKNTNYNIYIHYQSINKGAVPFIVMGCKFVRLGSGESLITLNNTLSKLYKKYPIKINETLAKYKSSNLTMRQASETIEKLVLKEMICNLTKKC